MTEKDGPVVCLQNQQSEHKANQSSSRSAGATLLEVWLFSSGFLNKVQAPEYRHGFLDKKDKSWEITFGDVEWSPFPSFIIISSPNRDGQLHIWTCCVHSASISLSIILDVPVTVFYGWDLHLNWWILCKADWASSCGWKKLKSWTQQ